MYAKNPATREVVAKSANAMKLSCTKAETSSVRRKGNTPATTYEAKPNCAGKPAEQMNAAPRA